nr:PREDICTED: phospholipid-transporting ATPase IK [Anolis carolinensis]|eukprot:XP_008123027.1 PREDICTED: phospholipid-transporting ATPase IK [Anolis carolinensis]
MIKTADIGVGISGQEGMQAVQCSDYALAQFRYLQRLLFVHGRWSYIRICKFLRYFFFKTFAGMMVQIWFAFYTGFTAQPLLEVWFLDLYHVFYTSYPVLCMGIFEQDVSAGKSLHFPELYKVGQTNQLFNFRTFCVSFLHGSCVSLVNFYITFWAMGERAGVHVIGDYQSFGMIVATSAIMTVTAEIMMEVKFWNIFSVLAIVVSLAFYCLFSYVTQSFEAYRTAYVSFPYPDAAKNALTDPTSLLVILLCVMVNVITSLTVRFVDSFSRSTDMSDMVETRGLHRKEKPVELTSHVRRTTFRRRSSYAFSHEGGYADLISRGASLRTKGPRGPTRDKVFRTAPPLPEESPVPSKASRLSPEKPFKQ